MLKRENGLWMLKTEKVYECWRERLMNAEMRERSFDAGEREKLINVGERKITECWREC